MTLLPEPHEESITNSAGIDDLWTCPACYADHAGHLDGTAIECSCGHRFRAFLDYWPVCRSELLAPDEDGKDEA